MKNTIDGVQLSEVTLYGTDGAPLAVQSAAGPGGVLANQVQTPDRTIDGAYDIQWYDGALSTKGYVLLVLTLASHTVVGEYQLYTRPTSLPLYFRLSGSATHCPHEVGPFFFSTNGNPPRTRMSGCLAKVAWTLCSNETTS